MSNPSSLNIDIYRNGDYLRRNPDWHVGESSWKAMQISKMLLQHDIQPRSVCEVGCGAGEVLKQLQFRLSKDCILCGYDISPQAFALSSSRANDRLTFKLMDISQETSSNYDLMLVLDVLEHVEDYFTLLRTIRGKAKHTLFHVPLDLSVQTILRREGLLKRRDLHAHLHYFTKEIILQLLQENAYKVVDYFYTPRSIDLGAGWTQALLRVPRAIGFLLTQDLCVRVLGGYSLMVLAR